MDPPEKEKEGAVYGNYIIFDHNGTASGGLLANRVDPGDSGGAAGGEEEAVKQDATLERQS